MKYLLDTSVVVNYLRGKKQLEEKVVKAGAAISIITQAELLYGVQKSNNPQKNLNLVNNLFNDLKIIIINLSEAIVISYANQKVLLEKKGIKLDELDLLIAATALVENLTLVTDNRKHFQRIKGIVVEKN